MKYFDIPDEEFEEFYNTELDELDFSVRAYNMLKRLGCETLTDVAYLSIEEIQNAKNAGKRQLNEVQEKLAERNIALMTQEEKENILNESDNPVVLKRQIRLLEHREKKSQETIRRYQRENDAEWNEVRANRTRALNEARGIVRTSPYPIARMLESMYFGPSAKEGCRFCNIFELRNEYGCFVEVDSMAGNDLTHSCEECIETFLADYYWGKRMSAKLAAERGEAPKVIRLNTNSFTLGMWGRCPVCNVENKYSSDANYCFRCGTALNWDEENWDKEIRESVEKEQFYEDLWTDEEDGDEE